MKATRSGTGRYNVYLRGASVIIAASTTLLSGQQIQYDAAKTIMIDPEATRIIMSQITDVEPELTIYKRNANRSVVSNMEDAFKAGKRWDNDKLRRAQKEYFADLKLYWNISSQNGVPNTIINLIPAIDKIAAEQDMYGYRDLIKAIIMSESFGYKYAVGPKGELGLMQINLESPRARVSKSEYKNIFDERTNITLGTKILKGCIEEFPNDIRSALEAYNAGFSRVLKHKVPRSSKEYAKSTLEHMARMSESE